MPYSWSFRIHVFLARLFSRLNVSVRSDQMAVFEDEAGVSWRAVWHAYRDQGSLRHPPPRRRPSNGLDTSTPLSPLLPPGHPFTHTAAAIKSAKRSGRRICATSSLPRHHYPRVFLFVFFLVSVSPTFSLSSIVGPIHKFFSRGIAPRSGVCTIVNLVKNTRLIV